MEELIKAKIEAEKQITTILNTLYNKGCEIEIKVTTRDIAGPLPIPIVELKLSV